MSTLVKSLFTLTVLAVGPTLRAGVVTFQYSGYVDIVDDKNSVLNGSIGVGTPFFGSYSFEVTTTPSYVDPAFTRYDGALRSSTLAIGSYTVNGIGGANRIITGNAGIDQFIVVADPRPFAGQLVSIGHVLWDYDGGALSTDALPYAPPPLSAFEDRVFSILTSNGSLGIRGVVTSLTPEPSAALVLATGAALLWSKARRRR